MDQPWRELGQLDPAWGPADHVPWADFQRTGDVVLTIGTGLGSLVNRALQSAYEGRWSRVTHAMCVVEPGLYLDASPQLGAVLWQAAHFPLRTGPTPAAIGRRFVAAFRHPRLAGCCRARAEMEHVLRSLRGVPYNFRFCAGRGGTGSAAFCSQLVVRALAHVGLLVLPDRHEATVLPHSLDLALRTGPWLDVSEAYRSGLAASIASASATIMSVPRPAHSCLQPAVGGSITAR